MDGGIFRLIHWAVKERFRSDKRGPGHGSGEGGTYRREWAAVRSEGASLTIR